jgi:hypothetical protein
MPLNTHLASLAGLLLALPLAGNAPDAPADTPPGPWTVRSAPLPEGWPALTPVGLIRVQRYPAYRAAVVEQVSDSQARASRRQNSMFMKLFRHIESNDIAMTAPVEMEYADDGMSAMAFLYRTSDLGAPGSDGAVEVRDLPARMHVSIGVRGSYSDRRFDEALAELEAWLAEEGRVWVAAGPPRYLGYNSPFVPPPMRYGEVQIPVRLELR